MTTEPATKTFTLEPLPYGYRELEPEISEETLRYHHDKHTAAYVNKLNELIAGTPYADMTLEEIIEKSDGTIFNNAAQAWNHKFYFETLSPKPKTAPDGELLDAVVARYGSLDNLKARMNSAATSLFGSGWVWLAADKDGNLEIMSGSNADNPLRHGLCPLLGIDVWEHAYYIDYRNARADAVQALWERIDWSKAEERYRNR